ncbi:MAG: MFS transporter [Eubacteriales bacterium]
MSGKEKSGIHFSPPPIVFGCGPVWPMLLVLAAKVFPDRSGSAYAVMMVFSTAGYMIFPFFMGSLVNNLNITLIGCGILSAIVFILSFLPEKFELHV